MMTTEQLVARTDELDRQIRNLREAAEFASDDDHQDAIGRKLSALTAEFNPLVSELMRRLHA